MLEGTVLGVDANSVGTTAVLVKDGEIIDRRTEPALHALLTGDAFDRLAALIKGSGAATAGLGLAGIRGKNEAIHLEAMLRAKTGVAVTVGDDVETAQLAAFDGGPGIVVVAHTGTNAFGRDASGRAARVGGYGHLLGDEGSHYWIAAHAITAALLSHDGRGPKAPALEDAITTAYGQDLDGVMRLIYQSSTDLSVVARVARVVMGVDDPVMRDIVDRAIEDLVNHAVALRRQLGPLPVAMVGGVFSNLQVRARFQAATGAIDPMRPSEYGSVLLATSTRAGRDTGWNS